MIDPVLAHPEVGTATLTVHCPGSFYTTKTPYQSFQDLDHAQRAAGRVHPVFVETLGRHGSRGLSSLKYDAAMLAIWQQAQTDGALPRSGLAWAPTSRS